MRQCLRRLVHTLLLVGAVAWSGSRAGAQPLFTPDYDRDQVQTLIAGLPKYQNFLILKYGCFSQRNSTAFGQEAALMLVEAAIAHQKAGSLAWAELSNIAARACFQIRSKNKLPDRGFGHYFAIFKSQCASETPAYRYLVQMSITDFVQLLAGGTRELNLGLSHNAQYGLLDAWHLYLRMVSTKPWGNTVQPLWPQAIASTQTPVLFQDEIKRLRSDEWTIWNARIYSALGQGVADGDPEDAQYLLPKAIAAYKREGFWGDESRREDLARVYHRLVWSYWGTVNYAKSIEVQRDFVRLFRCGRPELVRLLLENDDYEGAALVARQSALPYGRDGQEAEEILGETLAVANWFRAASAIRPQAVTLVDSNLVALKGHGASRSLLAVIMRIRGHMVREMKSSRQSAAPSLQYSAHRTVSKSSPSS